MWLCVFYFILLFINYFLLECGMRTFIYKIAPDLFFFPSTFFSHHRPPSSCRHRAPSLETTLAVATTSPTSLPSSSFSPLLPISPYSCPWWLPCKLCQWPPSPTTLPSPFPTPSRLIPGLGDTCTAASSESSPLLHVLSPATSAAAGQLRTASTYAIKPHSRHQPPLAFLSP